MKKSTFITLFIISIFVILCINAIIVFLFTPTKSSGEKVNTKELLQNERTEMGFSIASVIAGAVLEPLLDEDEAPIMDVVISTVKNSGGLIDYVLVVDSEGTLFGDSKKPTNVLKSFNYPNIKLLKSENRLIQEADSNIIDIGLAIKTGDKKRGEVHLGLKKVVFEDKGGEKKESPILAIILNIIVGIILSFIFALILSSKLSASGDFVNLRSAKIEELRKQEEEIQKTLASKQNEIKNKEKRIAELEKKIQETGSKYDEVDRIIKESEQEINEKRKQVEFYENKINELVEKQKNLKEEIDKVKEGKTSDQELKMLKNQIDTFKIQLQQIISDIEVKRNEEQKLSERINQLKMQASQIPQSVQSGGGISNMDLEKKRKEEFEITQRIVAKRKEEIALSQRLELKRKKELELTGRIEMLEKKLKDMGNS
ncbi:MAG: hypothetical protein QME48_02170 [bacterium]|uniref:Chromosome partition protein Smc n=2 Tax=Bacteria candidate phyla TaxID=1783234 RepID=A0A124G0D5_UNCT6|nr:MAG: Chromosome partition protein Smc [candidate division TA06 bacterium 32_111]KUK87142.1 MAG: Chromosome partition protein Smc [candidate division TA06 bacterium 34_109]MDI6700019.1 hypothetical protein [bacterium]HAF08403.1 hypothetical protein [candidate division WOR-3 bacterium]HCP17134.1 hypothetical protein [candidate division WOR-3 bacterium]